MKNRNDLKKCSKCDTIKNPQEFYKDRYKYDGLHSACKECDLQCAKRYRQRPEIKERRKEYHKEYYQRPGIKEHRKEYIREYSRRPESKKHRQEYYKRPEVKEHRKEYLQNNLHHYWALGTLQNHKRRGIQIDITTKEVEELAKKSRYCCFCGRTLYWKKPGKIGPVIDTPTLDRINNEKIINKENILIVCNQCNTTKGARTLREFKQYCKKVIPVLEKLDRGD